MCYGACVTATSMSTQSRKMFSVLPDHVEIVSSAQYPCLWIAAVGPLGVIQNAIESWLRGESKYTAIA